MKQVFVDRQPASSVRRQINPGPALAAVAAPRVAIILVMIVAVGTVLVDRSVAQDKSGPKPPRGFDEATTAAWRKAGAEVGWLGQDEYGAIDFHRQPDGLAGALPAFRLAQGREGSLDGLPV